MKHHNYSLQWQYWICLFYYCSWKYILPCCMPKFPVKELYTTIYVHNLYRPTWGRVDPIRVLRLRTPIRRRACDGKQSLQINGCQASGFASSWWHAGSYQAQGAHLTFLIPSPPIQAILFTRDSSFIPWQKTPETQVDRS